MQFEELSYSVKIPTKKFTMVERIKGLSLSGFPRTEWEEKYLLKDLTGTIKVWNMKSTRTETFKFRWL